MKFLLCMIGLLVWSQCGNASGAGGEYYLNGDAIEFDKTGKQFSIVHSLDGADSIIAFRTDGTDNIIAGRCRGSFLTETSSKVRTSKGGRPISSKITLEGKEHSFSELIYDSLESLTLKAPDDSPSVIRAIIITRNTKGPIGVHGEVGFRGVGSTIGCDDSSVADRLSLRGQKKSFLVSGANRVEIVLDPAAAEMGLEDSSTDEEAVAVKASSRKGRK